MLYLLIGSDYMLIIGSHVSFNKNRQMIESVEEAFAILLENYNTYMELLKENAISVNDVLPTGIVEV